MSRATLETFSLRYADIRDIGIAWTSDLPDFYRHGFSDCPNSSSRLHNYAKNQ